MELVKWTKKRLRWPGSTLAEGPTSAQVDELFRCFHEDFVHRLRRTADFAAMQRITQVGQLSGEAARYNMVELCEGAVCCLQKSLPNSGQIVHCTLKVVEEIADDPLITCIGRSLSGTKEGRIPLFGRENARRSGENTPFVALVGGSDSKTTWPNPFPTFICNDLRKHPEFVCARANYLEFYRSVLVFPLRSRGLDGNHIYLGFLTFDTELPNGFPGMPDTYDFLHKADASVDDFRNECRKQLCWTIGAAMADAIAACLRPYALTKTELEDPVSAIEGG